MSVKLLIEHHLEFLSLKTGYTGSSTCQIATLLKISRGGSFYIYSAKGNALYKEHEVAKLLRMVEQELSKSTYVMDWTRWYDAFNAQDREHRETLSADQV